MNTNDAIMMAVGALVGYYVVAHYKKSGKLF